ncbi:MAG: DinB family protein [Anaerolineales bacterium]|nr:DinB family protein [Anaerolineales bacterium]
MNIAAIKDIYEYNYWANKLLLSKAEGLSAEQFSQATSFSWRSLRGTLAHILDGEHGWRVIFQQGVAKFDVLVGAQFADAGAMRERWLEDEAEMWAYLKGVSNADLQETITFDDSGWTVKRTLWHCLWHVVNHGMQHRSECAAMLTDFGQSPGDIDFTVFLYQRDG